MRISIRTTDTGRVELPDLRPALDTIAADWTRGIQDRTRRGRDARGVPFRPKRDGSPSRLIDSGRMVGSLRADVGDKGFRLAPAAGRDATVAAINEARGRTFVAASERQIEDARRAVVDALREKR